MDHQNIRTLPPPVNDVGNRGVLCFLVMIMMGRQHMGVHSTHTTQQHMGGVRVCDQMGWVVFVFPLFCFATFCARMAGEGSTGSCFSLEGCIRSFFHTCLRVSLRLGNLGSWFGFVLRNMERSAYMAGQDRVGLGAIVCFYLWVVVRIWRQGSCGFGPCWIVIT